MARLVTLTTLQNRVKQRANVEVASNAALYSASELTDNINEGLAELYDLIIGQQDQPYYLSSAAFNTVAGTDVYKIGSGQAINITDFYKGKGLDVSFGQGMSNSAKPFMWSERNRYKWYPGWIYSRPVAYQFIGKSSGAVAQAGNDAIKLIPMPNGLFNCVLWYFPVLAPLVNGSDSFDGINGFEEYAVLLAAKKVLQKQEEFEHAASIDADIAREGARIASSLVTHDAESPMRVQDVTVTDGWIDY